MRAQDRGDDAPAAQDVVSDWEVRHDETSGAAYFFNIRTGESSWDTPTEESYIAAETTGLEDLTTLSQWAEVFDESRGCVYYVNLRTSETRWDPPPGYGAVAPTVDATNDVGKGEEEEDAPRMTTAEQMEKLNRLLSGDDDDDDEEQLHQAQPVSTIAPQLPPSSAGADVHEIPWMMFLNESDGIPYYYNHVTGECVWDPPADFLAYHQQQQQEAHAHDQHVEVETETEAEQREGARSGMQITSTTAATVREASLITPAFEEKVRRAIESVSKTPVGSSRVLFVRTPSEKWTEFTAARNDGGGSTDNEGPPRPGSDASATGAVFSARDNQEEAQPPTSSRMVATPGRPRSSRPGSAALGASSRPCTPQPAAISEHGGDADGLNVGGLEANQTNEKDETGKRSESLLSSKLVESYDPETRTFIHVVEPVSSSEQDEQQQQQPENLRKPSIADSENNKLSGMALQLRLEEAALVIECLVRCFLARRRVQKQRRARMEEGQRRQVIETSTQFAASDENEEPVVDETIGCATSLDEDVACESNDDCADQQVSSSATVAAQDEADVETQPEPAAFVGVDDSTSTEPNEDGFVVPEGDATLPPGDAAAATTAAVDADAGRVEPSLGEEISVLRSLIQSARSVSPQVLPDSVSLDREFEVALVPDRPLSPRPPTLLTAPNLAKDLGLVLDTQESAAVTPDLSDLLSHRVDLRDAEPTVENTQVAPSRSSESEPTLPIPEAKVKARPTSSSAKPRDQTPSSSSSAPSVLDIAQYFTKRPVDTLMESDKQPIKQPASTAAAPFIVRKRVELPKAKEIPAAVPEFFQTLAAAAECKQQQIHAASAASTRIRELQMQELSELRQLYQKSADKHAIERQQVLATLADRSIPAVRSVPTSRGDQSQSSTSNHETRSIWELLVDDVPISISKFNGTGEPGSESAFQSRISQQLLDRAAFVSAMESERLYELQKRLDHLHLCNQTLDAQLEAIDLCLLQEDHFPHSEDACTTALAANKKTFQAKYARKLRRKQNELLRAIEFWQQQAAEFPQPFVADSENIPAAPDISSSTTPSSSSSLYWNRVRQHFTKLSNQEARQRIRVLFSLRDANGDSLLHLAAWKGRQDDVARLLALADDNDSERVAFANLLDNTVSKCRPLHDACRGGHVEIARMLMAAGARLDVVDTMGDSPLHVACRLGWTQIVHFLLTAAVATTTEEDTMIASTFLISNNSVDKQRSEVLLSCSLSAFFHLRNHKKKRAMDLAKLPSLIAYLQQYERELPHDSEMQHQSHKKAAPQRNGRKRSKSGKP